MNDERARKRSGTKLSGRTLFVSLLVTVRIRDGIMAGTVIVSRGDKGVGGNVHDKAE